MTDGHCRRRDRPDRRRAVGEGLPAAIGAEARAAALRAGLAAYERGDFFEAHELLEPAWMGTADPVERELHQGLIKLAAGFVHAVRGNPLGIVKNLRGARERLARADGREARRRSVPQARGDRRAGLVSAIDVRLAALDADPASAVTRRYPYRR